THPPPHEIYTFPYTTLFRSTGIRKREQRHHDKGRDIVQRVFESENWRGHRCARPLEIKQHFLLSLAGQNNKIARFAAIEFVQQRARFLRKFLRVDPRMDRNRKSKSNTCNARVDARS